MNSSVVKILSVSIQMACSNNMCRVQELTKITINREKPHAKYKPLISKTSLRPASESDLHSVPKIDSALPDSRFNTRFAGMTLSHLVAGATVHP